MRSSEISTLSQNEVRIEIELDSDYDGLSDYPRTTSKKKKLQLRRRKHSGKNKAKKNRKKGSGMSVATRKTDYSKVSILHDPTVEHRNWKNLPQSKTMLRPLIAFATATITIAALMISASDLDIAEKWGSRSNVKVYPDAWTPPEMPEYPNGTFAVDMEICQSCCWDLNHRFDGNVVNDPSNDQYAPDDDLLHYYACTAIGCVGYEFDCLSVTKYVNNSGAAHPRGNSIRGCMVGQDFRTYGVIGFTPPARVANASGLDPDVGYQFECNATGQVVIREEVTEAPTPQFPTTPTHYPTQFPQISERPTLSPTPYPTAGETLSPTPFPTTASPTTTPPTPFPSQTTSEPTVSPTTKAPTNFPTTKAPTKSPTTKSPTKSPTTKAPTTQGPTKFPTKQPTKSPTKQPTKQPTPFPSLVETSAPTDETGTSAPTTESPTTAPVINIPANRSDSTAMVNNYAWVGGVAGMSGSSLLAGVMNFRFIV